MTLPTYNTNQWRIQGRGPRGLGPPLYLDQIEARKAEKYFFGRPPSYLRVWAFARGQKVALMKLAFINLIHMITVWLNDFFFYRRRKVLCTGLLLVDNTRRSKSFLRVLKMWIKVTRYQSLSVYVNLMLCPASRARFTCGFFLFIVRITKLRERFETPVNNSPLIKLREFRNALSQSIVHLVNQLWP